MNRRDAVRHRFLGEYDKDRILRCIRCGMPPSQHYQETKRRATRPPGGARSGEGRDA